MKRTRRVWWLVLLGTIILAACGKQEGITAFSPGNDRVAVITNTRHLYTTNFNGGDAIRIEDDEIFTFFDVSFDPFGQKILYVYAPAGICISKSTGGGRSCPVKLPPRVVSGLLSFLPSGEFVFIYLADGQTNMRVYNTNGSVIKSEDKVDQFFLPTDAYKVKRGSDGQQWSLRPYNRPGGQQSLHWVTIIGAEVHVYNATGHLEGPIVRGTINTAVQNALMARDQTDITSGAVSPDGSKLVFRTKTGRDPNFVFGLWMLDLDLQDASPVQLVSNADFRIQYAFSPDSTELVYESNVGGRSVWIAKTDGSNQRKLADNASLPTWH